jgi:hypothetical protein
LIVHRAGLLVVVWLAACSSPPPPPPPPVVEQRVARGPSAMESEIGGMNEEAVEKAFAAIQPSVLGCVHEGAQRIKELGGHFEISMRIDREGKARWVHLRGSTLGDRTTERCIADVARSHTWPRPVGGEGLANRAFDIDAGKPPVEWDPDRLRSTLRLASKDVARCRRGDAGTFVLTGYVRSDGKVVGAGVAAEGPDSEVVADCLAEAALRWRFGFIGRRTAKFSVALEP